MSPEPRALAVLCDKCIEENRLPEYAVEWDVENNVISYHRVEELTPLPSLEEVRKKEAGRNYQNIGGPRRDAGGT